MTLDNNETLILNRYRKADTNGKAWIFVAADVAVKTERKRSNKIIEISEYKSKRKEQNHE